MKILIMGLPGSGKTTFAAALFAEFLANDMIAYWYNADDIREKNNDWDFSPEGRMRQATRMFNIAEIHKDEHVICDFVAPLEEMRKTFNADYVIWMNTVYSSRYEDTNNMFQIPENVDYQVQEMDYEKWVPIVFEDIRKKLNG
jgi:adenylylsulfate kinase